MIDDLHAPEDCVSWYFIPLSTGALAFLLHIFTSQGYGFFRDELYYMACGRHLDWGYIDHPPLIALLARLTHLTLGDSLVAIHFSPALAAGAIVFLAALMARELGGGRLAQATAALCVIFSPVFFGLGYLFSTIVFDQLWWVLGSYLLVRLLRTDNPRLFLWIGVVIGIGLLTKHNMLFFTCGLAFALVLTPARKHLVTPWPWIGVAVAALIFLPNVLWQIAHGWPTLSFLRGLRQTVLARNTLLGTIREIILFANPVTIPLAAAGQCYYVFSKKGRAYRTLGCMAAVIVLVSLLQHAKSYYLAPIYPLMLAAGSVVLEQFVHSGPATSRKRAWVPAAFIALVVMVGAMEIPLVAPVLPRQALLRYTAFWGMTKNSNWTGGSQRLPSVFADMLGWPELARTVAGAYDQLPPEDRARAVIYARNFGEAGALDLFGPALGLPPAVSGNHNYWLWGPGNSPGEVLLVVGDRLEDVQRNCPRSSLLAIHQYPDALSLEQSVPIVVCRDLQPPLRDLWPQLRHGF